MSETMTDKEKIAELENQIEELSKANEYFNNEVNCFWADLRKRQKFNLEIAQRIVKTDSKAVANIILNMYFGKMPSDSVGFCEIFDLKGKGCCKEGLRCTIAYMISLKSILITFPKSRKKVQNER